MTSTDPAYPKPAELCPKCGRLFTKVSNATGHGAPEPGDWSVCIGYSALLRFGPALRVYLPSHVELAALSPAMACELAKVRVAVILANKGETRKETLQ